MTGYQTLNPSNYLSAISLYRDRDKALAHRDGKYRAIPARHRDKPQAKESGHWPDSFAK
jgi:hypothetical protein